MEALDLDYGSYSPEMTEPPRIGYIYRYNIPFCIHNVM